ncbi:MAG: flagellar hook-basal body complex protein FliE [Deltaproteobacteria bacterium]|nr:flagellar hook-basal body complex protein FliE [Deltaproteobacteria bacterium]
MVITRLGEINANIQPAASPAAGPKTKSFGDMLKKSVEDVNKMQNEAVKAEKELAVGDPKQLHQTMIDIEQAGISMRLMLQVRNKVIDAYQEIMRMPV